MEGNKVKADYFNNFNEKVIPKTVVLYEDSFYQKHKPLIWAGYFSGEFPIRGALSSCSTKAFVFTKMSLPFLLSMVLFVLKTISVVHTWGILSHLNNNHRQTVTDLVVATLVFLCCFCSGQISHIVTLCQLPQFLQVLQAIEDYDLKFPRPPGSSASQIPLKRVLLSISFSLFNVYTPLFGIYQAFFSPKTGEPYQPTLEIVPGVVLENTTLTFMYMNFGFLILELGVVFMYLQIFMVTALLQDRLDHIQTLIEEKVKNGSGPKQTLEDKVRGSDQVPVPPLYRGLELEYPKWIRSSSSGGAWAHGQATWRTISSQYIEFESIFNKYKSFSGLYFVVLFVTLIVSCVCNLFYGVTAISRIAIRCKLSLICINAIAFFRIGSLTNCGEVFERKHQGLVKALMRVYNDGSFREEERSSFKKLLTLVTKLKLRLSALGYFTVSRTNVTSITGVVITYMIVLLQFNFTDNSTTTPGPRIFGFVVNNKTAGNLQ